MRMNNTKGLLIKVIYSGKTLQNINDKRYN